MKIPFHPALVILFSLCFFPVQVTFPSPEPAPVRVAITEGFSKEIELFLKEWDPKEYTPKPLNQLIWNDDHQACLNDLLAAMAFGELDQIVLMWCTSTDPEFRTKAAVCIIGRPMDVIQSQAWEKDLLEYSKRYQKQEFESRAREITVAKQSSIALAALIEKLFNISKPKKAKVAQ